uniref:MFS transporter n=1 Tax=Anaerolinea thermolimosa TaxID=229919 RepID=A0A7C4PLI8_9CHLR
MNTPWLYRLLRINPHNEEDRSAFYLVVEIFFAAILGAAASFNGAYAIRLGASNEDIGLLTSLPALLAVIISIPAGRFLQGRARRKPWIAGSLLMHRAGFLLVALVPLLKIAGVNQGTVAVALLIIISAPAHFFNVGWIPMLADVIPPERRATVFSARNITANATTSVCVFLFGQWLNHGSFPVNYQLMYVFGFLASLLSQYFILKINVPDSQPEPPNGSASFAAQWHALRTALRDEPDFQRLTTNTILHGIGLWLASPLYILYYVRQLDASDAWLGLHGTVLTTTTILGWMFWRWVIARTGEMPVLKRTIITLGLIPILVGLLPNLNLILLVVGLNGLLSPAVNLSHFNSLLKVTPPAKRPVYTGLYISIVNIGTFICPLIGVAIADRVGLAPALIAFGALSVLGSTSFLWRPVRI